MELLPHDVYEQILERLAVKPLLRFKCVSKQWRSIIESRKFQETQLVRRQSHQDPDVLLVSVGDNTVDHIIVESLRTLVVGSSVSLKIRIRWEETVYQVCSSSCDGLICLYDLFNLSIVVNPITRWHRTFPLSSYQLLTFDAWEQNKDTAPFLQLGFGKDKFRCIYKPVWLYNSFELGLENATTCEVFDFSTNTWRFVVPASPYRIMFFQYPTYFDGSLHWFTAPYEGETKVLSFDLHTETFQVISKAPFVHDSGTCIAMCNLNNSLCVSEVKCTEQKIWSFNAEKEAWDKIYSIDLLSTFKCFGFHAFALRPLAVLGKNKLLFYERDCRDSLVLHDPQTGSYGSVFKTNSSAYILSYFQSLISIL